MKFFKLLIVFLMFFSCKTTNDKINDSETEAYTSSSEEDNTPLTTEKNYYSITDTKVNVYNNISNKIQSLEKTEYTFDEKDKLISYYDNTKLLFFKIQLNTDNIKINVFNNQRVLDIDAENIKISSSSNLSDDIFNSEVAFFSNKKFNKYTGTKRLYPGDNFMHSFYPTKNIFIDNDSYSVKSIASNNFLSGEERVITIRIPLTLENVIYVYSFSFSLNSLDTPSKGTNRRATSPNE